MKHTKRIFALLLAVLMIAALSVTAFAAEGAFPTTKGKITLTNAEDGETYTIYKILTLASFSDDKPAADDHTTDHYSYVIETGSKWLSFIKSAKDTSGTNYYFTVDETNPVTLDGKNYYLVTPTATFTGYDDETTRNKAIAASGNEVQKFAQAALAYAKDSSHGVSPNSTSLATNTTVEFTNLELGYYLIDSTLGTLCTLDTTNNEVNVIDKNENPSIIKQVKDRAQENAERNSTTNKYEADVWTANTDYSIGDTVKFLTTITAKKGATNYVLHDVMEKGLTLVPGVNNGNFKVYTTNGDTTSGPIGASESTYSIVTTSLSDGCDFEIRFMDSWVESLADGTKIEIEYQATLNGNAIIKGVTETADTNTTKITPIENAPVDQIPIDNNTDGKNTNSTILSFGSGSSTEWATATVETFEFDLVKTKDAASGSDDYDLLANAKFKFYTADQIDEDGKLKTEATATKFIGDTTNQIYRLPGAGETATVDEFVSDDTHKINFEGLEAGTYYLDETTAPNGYNKLSGLIKVVVDSNGKITVTLPGGTAGNPALASAIVSEYKYSTKTENQGGVHVVNKTGVELPSTGGIGTTIFYVVGGILVAGALIVLITKKRMGKEEA